MAPMWGLFAEQNMTDDTGAAAPASEPAAPSAPAGNAETPTETIRDLDAVSETPAETTPEVKPEVKDDQPEGDDDSTDQPKRLTRSQRQQRKLARLSTMLAERDAEVERLRQAAPAKSDTGSEPKEADYNGDWTKYQADYAAWKATESIKGVLNEEKQQQKAAALQEKVREANEDFLERVEEIKPRIPDFDKVMSAFEKDGGKFASHVIEEIRDSEKGPALAHHLAKTPDLVAELNAMSPRDAAREIGRLEAKISLPKPRTQTQAPAPITPITGGASPGFDPNTSDDMEAYVKWRKKA